MLLGRDIAWFGFRPFPVVTAYSGREALFYYLSVPLHRIFGTYILASRLTSAFLGVLAVAATLALGRALFRWHRRGRWIALLAGAWLAVNGPQVWLTRQGFRTSPQPLLEALCLWLLVVAAGQTEHTGRRRLMIAALAGAFGGLTLYVYMAARIFPPWLLIPLAALFLLDRRRLGVILAFGTALSLTALPILVFYVRNPAVLLDRLAQVAPGSSTPTIAESLVLHLRMFFIEGDPLLRYNLYPGRPFFDLISGGLLIVGLGAAAWLAARRGVVVRRLAGVMLLFCPLLIAPSLIATGGLPPSHMRSVAMVPLVMFLPALGLVSLAQIMPRLPRLLAPALSAVLIVAIGLNTWADYRAWAARADLFYDADGDLMLAAQWLEAQQAADSMLYAYVASRYYEHPTVFAYPLDPARIRWMMGEHLFLPPTGQSAVYILPRSVGAADADAWAERLQAHAVAPEALPAGPDGSPAFRAYRIHAGEQVARPQPQIALDANVGGVLRLRGADLPQAQAGQSATMTLYWEILRTPDRADLAPVVGLVEPGGDEIGRFYPYFERTADWRPGEWLIGRVAVAIPAGSPPGDYALRVTWVGKSGQDVYIPLHDADGRFAGLWAGVGPLRVTAGAVWAGDPPPDSTPVVSGLSARLTVAPPEQIEQGDPLRFVIDWLATAPLDTSGLHGLQLVAQATDGPTSPPVTLWQGDPARGAYPFAQWRRGERVTDRYGVPIPADLPAGAYRLRLLVRDSAGEYAVFDRPLKVLAVERQFTPPTLAHTVDWQFGPSIALVGYTVQPEPGDSLRVRLAWQARAVPDRDYTLTVQVQNPDGSIFSQQDGPPARPTSRWVAGEVITGEYVLHRPPNDGPYRVIVALYLPENGARLPVQVGTQAGDAAVLGP